MLTNIHHIPMARDEALGLASIRRRGVLEMLGIYFGRDVGSRDVRVGEVEVVGVLVVVDGYGGIVHVRDGGEGDFEGAFVERGGGMAGGSPSVKGLVG
jgi:hypothetical protein